MRGARIHRLRSEGHGFAAVPDATARDVRLSWAARGYLAEMLSNRDDWRAEPATGAAARAKRERRSKAESAWQVRKLMAELEEAGYRHRIKLRGPRGRTVTEVHYYDLAAQPCPDSVSCESCRSHVPDLAQQAVSPGATKCGVTSPG